MSEAVRQRPEFLSPFTEVEDRLSRRGPDWLREMRHQALLRFSEIGFPTTRMEAWRTTNVAPIVGTRFRPGSPAVDLPQALPPFADAVPDALRLVFVDGHGIAAPAQEWPDGVWCGRLAEALERFPERLKEYLGHHDLTKIEAFRALNTAFCEDGGVVLVSDGVELERPIHLTYLSTIAETPVASHPRTLVVAGRASRVQLVESHLGLGEGTYLSNSVSELFLGAGASVEHCRVQAESEQAFHVSTVVTVQERDSRYSGFNFDLGGKLVRHDLVSRLEGDGCFCNLDGLYVTRGDQRVDNHTVLDHARPQCGSREVYKGILSGASRATFNGRIVVRQAAQRTDARQSNPNLLLSTEALVQTRPQLEIYADDVKCTHGATVGRLDEDAIFYLRSRAIPEAEARRLLVSAFADEVIDRVGIASLRESLKRAAAERLPFRAEG